MDCIKPHIWIAFPFFMLFLAQGDLLAQGVSIPLTKDQVLILKDTVIIPGQDTVILLNSTTSYKVKPNPYARSEAFYDSLRSYAYRSKLTQRLYTLILRSPTQNMYDTDSISKSESYFSQYQDRRISKITVSHVPIFEGNVQDTSKVIFSKIGDWINKTKRYTKPKIIRANILFTEGDKVNHFVLADSERILRRLSYIEDARIYVEADEDSEEVHINIVVKDRFPWAVGGKYSSLTNFQFDLSNRNIMGSGNQLNGSYLYNQEEQLTHGFALSYQSKPFGNTLILSELSLSDNWRKRGMQARVFKDFLSPEVRYGGEVSLGNVEEMQDIRQADSLLRLNVKRRYWDSWVGKALLSPDHKRRLSLIASVRYMNVDFLQGPEVSIDSNERFHDRRIILGSLNLLKYNFLKTNYILSFGVTEDVPIGFDFSLIHGRDFTDFRVKNYTGAKLGWSHYFNAMGYLTFIQEAGAFWNLKETENFLSISSLGYFSPLLRLNRLSIRNFFQLKYTRTNNLSYPEGISLREEMTGLGGSQTFGENVFSARLESVWFMPWFVYGFRFAPFMFYEFGNVDEKRIEQFYNVNYGSLGAGLRIRNESLAIRTFEFHASWLPKVPEGGQAFSIELSFSAPIAFDNYFNAKPRMIYLE